MAPFEIFNWNRTEAYCIRIFKVVYLKMPTRKTGIVSRILLLENKLNRVSTKRPFFEDSELRVVSLEFPNNGAEFIQIFDFGCGIIQSKSRQEITDAMAVPDAIQGDVSIVTDAKTEARSSAT